MKNKVRNLIPVAILFLTTIATPVPELKAQPSNIPTVQPPSCFCPSPSRGFGPKHVYGIFSINKRIYAAVAAGRDSTYFLSFRNTGELPVDSISIINNIEGLSIGTLRAADTASDGLVFWTEKRRFVLRNNSWKTVPNSDPEIYKHHGSAVSGSKVGLDHIQLWVPPAWTWYWTASTGISRRYLLWGGHLSIHSYRGPGKPGIMDLDTYNDGREENQQKTVPGFFPLPQPTRKHFEKYVLKRPIGSKKGRYLDYLEADFGAYDVYDGKIWFGLTFYYGEGVAGVGGYGHFDPATESYDITWGTPVADKSVSALYHGGDAIWMGMVSRQEWAYKSGGLARVDPANETVVRYEVPDPIDIICPIDDNLWIGTRNGLYIFKEDSVRAVWPQKKTSKENNDN